MSILAAPFSRRSLENPNVPITAYQLADIFGGGPTRAGVQVNEKTALSYAAVYTCVRIISEAIGNLPIKVYRRVDADNSQLVTNSPEAYMLGCEANDEQTAVVAKNNMQAWQCLWGNGYARLINARTTRQMIPIRSDRVNPERRAGKLVFRVEGNDPAGGITPGDTFDSEEIIHLPGLSLNGITGLSPIGLHRETIATGRAKDIFDGTFYGNGTNIGGTLEFPHKLTPEAKQAVRESWNAKYQGVANANSVAILDQGAKYNGMVMRLVDAQFVESRQFTAVDVFRIFRVPPHMGMDLSRSTNNNIEQQSLEFLLYCLLTWITIWEQEINRKVFGVGSEFFVAFDLTRLLMADMDAMQKFFAAGRQWGYLTVNDIRRRLGLNSVPEGDMLLVPQNMVPADKTHPLIDSQIAKNHAGKTAGKKPEDPEADPNAEPDDDETSPSTTPAGPVGLNGAQITAAIDIVTKLRSGTIETDAAAPLLVSLGIDEDKALAIVKATPYGKGGAESDKQFLRTLLLAFAANPQTTAIVANAVKVNETVKGAGAPVNAGYEEPWMPVTTPPGQAVVSGDVVKDPQGDVVGGAVEKSPPPAAPNPAPPKDDPSQDDPPAPPVPDPAPEPAAEPKQAARTLARKLFTASARRMVRKEANAIRRTFVGGSSVVGDAAGWAEKFYAEHREHSREAFGEPAEAIAEMIGGSDKKYIGADVVALFVEDSTREMRAMLLQLAADPAKRHSLATTLLTHEEEWPVFAGNLLTEKLLRALS